MIKTDKIKNIIFDFGGVIINLDYQASYDEFKKLGLDDFSSIYPYAEKTGMFGKFEKGELSSEEFRNELRKFLSPDVTDREIDHAWNAILLDIPKERIELIEKLRTKFRIFLLSNTNIIHYRHYVTGLKNVYGYRDFSDLFEKAYFSHELGQRKPCAEIYEHVIRDSGLIASETLFVDDMSENVEGAKRAGLLTHLLPPHQSITNLF